MTGLLLIVIGLAAQAQTIEPVEPTELLPLETAPPSSPAAPAAPVAPTAPTVPSELLANTFSPGSTVFVEATSLALRAEPRRDAMLIHYMPHDAKLQVVQGDMNPVPDTVNGQQGYWIYVQHGTQYGWAFDQFLVGAPPDLEDNLDWSCVPGQRVGPIRADTTVQDLVSIFGESNVSDAKIPIAGGNFEAGTVIFPDSPEKRLFIQWAYPNKRVHSVIVEGTRWRTPAGIAIGTRIQDIVRANGAPFKFAGFGWEYGGYVMSWNQGLLERDHVLGDGVFLYLAPQPPYLPSDYEALQGDKEFSSDMPEASKLNLRVRAMTILMRL
jgi:hypothetical protein